MTAPALLVAEDLDKEYRSGPELVRVLRGASLALRQGEMVALVGASGVGKSTLLHLLGALDRPTAGRVLWEGEDLFGRPESGLVRYRRHEVGFVFQFYNLLGETSEVIYDLFLRLQAERGIAFLVATHNPDLARRAERGYRLVEGRAREIE